MSGVAYLGTCPWCFRAFRSTRERCTMRHGWNEVSFGIKGAHLGGRRVGEYGNVNHSGDCSGMPFPPYELSPDGTKARLAYELAGVAACEKALATLATRPPLTTERSYSVYERSRTRFGHTRIDIPYSVRLLPGDEFTLDLGPNDNGYGSRTEDFSYESSLLAAVHERESLKADFESKAKFCEKKIATWKLTELPEFEARKATVHYRSNPKRPPWCGSKSYDISSSENADEVTCTRCLNAMETSRAEDAAIATEKANARRVYDWVKEHNRFGHGPTTSKAIKAALGLDTKAFNRAVERASSWKSCLGNEYISSDGSSPVGYSARVLKP